MISSKKTLATIIASASVGTIIEWYDFYIFGSLATIISTKFFPQSNPTAGFLATLATYGVGLLVRPFGALFFGRLGDLIGRKYTFMITLILMGGSTFLIGLVPNFETIGFLAPIAVLILRLLQGLAIGGEFGGAATFVAEHSPINKRGYWTSWIQMTGGGALVLSFGAIYITKMSLTTAHWEAWGWRLPFLVSSVLVVVSVIIRKKMKESPLFVKAKLEGKTSSNPLKESFGNRENLKVVLAALFGLTFGIGVMGYASTGFVQNFMVKFLFVDYDQVNSIIIIGISLGVPFYIFFGWLSDYVGRKPIMMLSLLLGILCFRPIYRAIYQTVNLANKVENISALTVYNERTQLPNSDSLISATTIHAYSDGTIFKEEWKQLLSKGEPERVSVKKTVHLNDNDKRTLILYIFLFASVTAMSAGPAAASLVEMFPLKIRYTSLSLPYHIGYGIFGGMCPVIAAYLIGKASDAGEKDYFLSGMNYPILVMTISLMIGLLYLKDDRGAQFFRIKASSISNGVRRGLGILWILMGVAAAYIGIFLLGIPKINLGTQDDLIFGIIVTTVLTPVIAAGLFLFGKYAWQGEYDV